MSNTQLNTHILLQKLAKGNELAFTSLFNNYKDLVYGTAVKILKSENLAEEVVQEIFLKIWKNREQFSKVDNFENYLFISTRNYIFDLLKKIARERLLHNPVDYEHFITEKTDFLIKENQYNEILSTILNKLPKQQLKVYKLIKEQGLTHQQVGKVLNISPLTSKKHMAEALKFIRKHIYKHLELIIYCIIYSKF